VTIGAVDDADTVTHQAGKVINANSDI